MACLLFTFSWLFRGFFVALFCLEKQCLGLFRGFFVAPILGKIYAYSPWNSLLIVGAFNRPRKRRKTSRGNPQKKTGKLPKRTRRAYRHGRLGVALANQTKERPIRKPVREFVKSELEKQGEFTKTPNSQTAPIFMNSPCFSQEKHSEFTKTPEIHEPACESAFLWFGFAGATLRRVQLGKHSV